MGYRIAIYHHKFHTDGVSRVVSHLINVYLSLGHDVILINSEIDPSKDYDLPSEVKRFKIPKATDIIAGVVDYTERGNLLKNILFEEKIDIFCYHTVSNMLLPLDMEVVQNLGIPFVGVKHEMFSQNISIGRDVLTMEQSAYRKMDMLVVLSKTEEIFWNALGVNCIMLPNPISKDISNNIYNADSTTLIWVGRLDYNQKCYQDLVEIMKIVKEKSQCVLKVYGRGDTFKDEIRLLSDIEAAGLTDRIELCGYNKDISDIYSEAALMLVTSAYETFPMNVYEAKQNGIPIVSYSMPYVEMLHDGMGYIEVQQGDINGAANEIIRFMGDRLKRITLSKEARESYEMYADIDIKSMWKLLFEQMMHGENKNLSKSVSNNDLEYYSIILQSIIFHQSILCSKYQLLRKQYIEMKEQKKITDIEKKVMLERKEIAIYPYGKRGKEIERKFGENGIKVTYYIDNKLSKNDNHVLSLDDFSKIDNSNIVVVVCSDSKEYSREIRENLSRVVVNKERIIDWFMDLETL